MAMSPESALPGRVALALMASYGLASASIVLPRLPGKLRPVAFAFLSGLLFVCPLLVPDQWYHLPRGVVAAVAVFFWLKAWDAYWRPRLGAETKWAARLTQMLNFGLLVAASGQPRLPARPVPARLWDVLVWLVAFLAATAVLYGMFAADWRGWSFIVEHVSKSSVVTVVIHCAMNCHAALWRLAGVRSLHSPASVILARSPAEYWRRWNRPVGHWLYVHVCRRLGGRSPGLGAIVVTFAVSGLLHEYLVAMITKRVTGYPTAFFLLQGLAVAATFRFAPKAPWSVAAIALTLAFNACASVLLFVPFNLAMPFYTNAVPHWLGLQ
jgi:hypothetical protein